jgi:uncharacterized membrane-anchored protein
MPLVRITALFDRDRPEALKVPLVITGIFWVSKILSTALGETTSDWMVHNWGAFVAVAIGALVLLGSLALQFVVSRYVPWIYWLAVAMVAVAGTIGADALHVGAGIPYAVSTTFYAIVVTVLFVTWSRIEGTLSIHSITNPRRELFYWLTVLATFALGTAVGDLTAVTFHLGFVGSAILYTALFAVPTIGYWKLNMNGILAFWFAYVLTRPMGASYADWLGKPKNLGGQGLGLGWVSLILTLLFLVPVIIQQVAFTSNKKSGQGVAAVSEPE